MDYLLCAHCFKNKNLQYNASKIGIIDDDIKCKNCNSYFGEKLSEKHLIYLIDNFFKKGSTIKCNLGESEHITFSDTIDDNIKFSNALKSDVQLLREKIGVTFFYYAPRLCKIGYTDIIESLEDKNRARDTVNKIISSYPIKFFKEHEFFYRLRSFTRNCTINLDEQQFDTPPLGLQGNGRFDKKDFPVLYGSQNINICFHECQIRSCDDIYIADLYANRALKLLDFSHFLEEKKTPFESIDFAINLIFSSNSAKAYQLSKYIAQLVYDRGFDGIITPSFHSQQYSAINTFETQYGISLREYAHHNVDFQNAINCATIPNISLFGFPVKDKIISVKNIRKLIINNIIYEYEMAITQNDYD